MKKPRSIHLRKSLHHMLADTGLIQIERTLSDYRDSVVTVLLYHRVGEPESVIGDPALVSVRPADFEQQMAYIAEHCTPIKPQQLIDATCADVALPPRSVLVTFDDGYRDFLTTAWPVLRRYNVPATVFIPTSYIDSYDPFWWDALHIYITRSARESVSVLGLGTLSLRTNRERYHAVRCLNARLLRSRPETIAEVLGALSYETRVAVPRAAWRLSWNEVDELATNGMTVGSHTRTHSALPMLTQSEMVAEIRGAQEDLCRVVGIPPRLFSYPLGFTDERSVPILRSLGVVAAFTTVYGVSRIGTDHPLLLPRVPVSPMVSFAEFRLSVTYAYAWLRSRLVALTKRG